MKKSTLLFLGRCLTGLLILTTLSLNFHVDQSLLEISMLHGLATTTREGVGLPRPFRIIVLTMDRFDSLQRLLNSLRATDYIGDTIDLEIRFDRPPVPNEQWWKSVERTQQATNWTAGEVFYTVAESNMGLRKAWLTAWTPSSPIEQAIILEDDVEVSPLWYQWLKGAYNAYKDRQDIAGISLQRQSLVPDKFHRGTNISDHNGFPFLYKLVGSIGYSPRASVWMNFVDFANCAIDTGMSVETPDLITSDWYQSLDKSTMWTQLFIYFCHYHSDLFTLYLFPSGERALAAHWREKGEHFPTGGGRDFALANQARLAYPEKLPKLGWGASAILVDPEPLETLVMSAAIGYNYQDFKRFLHSLRRHYNGDVLLLIGQGVSAEIMSLVDHYGAQVIISSFVGGARSSDAWKDVNRARWNFYKDGCRLDKYDLCMAVDFRDSIFQDYPFLNMKVTLPTQLHVYEHNLMMNLWHLEEATKCGQSKEFLINKPIINAGGLVATPAIFGQLVKLVLGKFETCDDQVALNLAVYGGDLYAHIHSYPQGEGSINNVAWGGKFRRDSQGRFLNRNCFPAPVVHQFDLYGEAVEGAPATGTNIPAPVVHQFDLYGEEALNETPTEKLKEADPFSSPISAIGLRPKKQGRTGACTGGCRGMMARRQGRGY